jgi:hypothetical protein
MGKETKLRKSKRNRHVTRHARIKRARREGEKQTCPEGEGAVGWRGEFGR